MTDAERIMELEAKLAEVERESRMTAGEVLARQELRRVRVDLVEAERELATERAAVITLRGLNRETEAREKALREALSPVGHYADKYLPTDEGMDEDDQWTLSLSSAQVKAIRAALAAGGAARGGGDKT